MNDLKIISELSIDKENYMLSLLRQCAEKNLISQSKLASIRACLDDEFTETAEQYTKRSSSSISKKLAEQIYSSVLYRGDVYLLSLKSDEAALNAITKIPTSEILEKGKNLILQYFEECRLIFAKAYKYRLNLQISEYRYIMDKAFNDFFFNYSARFSATSSCMDIDYPLLYKKAFEIKSKGVLFVREYYTAIMLENEFCSLFNENDIKKILVGMGKIYRCNFYELLTNIAEAVLISAFSGLMVGKEMPTIAFNHNDLEKLKSNCSFYTECELKATISSAFSGFYRIVKNPALIMYLRNFIPVYSNELYTHLKNNNIEAYIPCVD